MRVPQFQDIEVTKFMNQYDMEIQRFRKDTLSSATANKSVLLYSPSKKVYEITVDDSGVLHATKVAG